MTYYQRRQLAEADLPKRHTHRCYGNLCLRHESSHVRKQLRQMVLEHFAGLPHSKKMGTDMDSLLNKITRAGWVLYSSITWGVPNVIDTIISLVSATWALIELGYLPYFPYAVCAFAGFYVLYYKPRKELLGTLRNQRKEEEKVIDNTRSFALAQLQEGESTPDAIAQLFEKEEHYDNQFDVQWEKIASAVSNITLMVAGSALSITIPSNFWAVKTVLDNMVSAISCTTHFVNNLSARGKDWDSIAEWYADNKDVIPDPKQKPLPAKGLRLTVNATKGECTVKGGISVPRGKVTILRGPSGCGKTVAINAVSGRDEGADTRQYMRKFLVCTQKSRDNLPTKGTSIQQIFDGAPADYIRPLLNIVQLSSRFHDLDTPYEQISGGERMRLAVALEMYNCIKKGCQVLVLDEPEQGLDHDNQIAMLNGVIHWCKTKKITLLMVYHGNALDILSLEGVDTVWEFDKLPTHTQICEQPFAEYAAQQLQICEQLFAAYAAQQREEARKLFRLD